jgi:hypothetical protein
MTAYKKHRTDSKWPTMKTSKESRTKSINICPCGRSVPCRKQPVSLSLSYDIIKAHDGEIKVETKENEFAEFTILLPA